VLGSAVLEWGELPPTAAGKNGFWSACGAHLRPVVGRAVRLRSESNTSINRQDFKILGQWAYSVPGTVPEFCSQSVYGPAGRRPCPCLWWSIYRRRGRGRVSSPGSRSTPTSFTRVTGVTHQGQQTHWPLVRFLKTREQRISVFDGSGKSHRGGVRYAAATGYP
jgi:hypothetical protein